MKGLPIILCLIFVEVCQANNLKNFFIPPADSVNERYDTAYIDPLPNFYTLRLYGNLKQIDLSFDDPSLGIINANAGDFLRLGGGFGYRWIIFNYAYGRDPRRKNTPEKIRHFDFHMNVFTQRILYDIRTQFYKGFKLAGQYRDDISTLSLGGSLRHNFNPKKYSFKSSYDQTQWQKKSAGAPIAGISLGYLRLKGDSAFYNPSGFAALSSFHENYNLAVGLGYSYTFVYRKHWFATAGLTLYADNTFVGSLANFEERPSLTVNLLPEVRAAVGYNSKNVFVGLQGMWFDTPGLYSNDITYHYKYNNIKLIFAHRFYYNIYKNKHE